MIKSAEQNHNSAEQKNQGLQAESEDPQKFGPLAQHNSTHQSGGKQYIIIESRKKKEVINISSSEGENLREERLSKKRPQRNGSQHQNSRIERIKKIKKVSIKCQLCKAAGKKSEMKACIVCKHNFHTSCIEIDNRVPKRYECDKCKFKKQAARKEIQYNQYLRQQAQKQQREKQRLNSLDRDKQKNLLVTSLNAPLDKATLKKSQKERKKEEQAKRFKEFAERYPYYIHEDRIKFPINDKLMIVYKEICDNAELTSASAGTSRSCPEPQEHPSIPAHRVADMLQIENFFQTFKTELKQEYGQFKEIEPDMTRLYDLLDNDLLDPQFSSMVYCLLKIYMNDIFEKNKTDNVKMLNENCFFTLMTNMNEFDDLNSEVIVTAAEEIVRYLSEIPSMKRSFQNFNYPKSYNIETKIDVLVALLKGLSEVDTFHDFVAMKSEKMQKLTKEKGDLVSSLKTDEAENLSNKEKIKEFNTVDLELDEQLNNNEKNGSIANSRQISKQKDKNQRKIYKLTTQKHKSESNIKEMRLKIAEISKNIPFITSLLVFLGKDRNESEYFFYQKEPHRIYCKYHNYLLDDSENFLIFEGRLTISELAKSLSSKGFQEKHLLDMINNFMKEEIIHDIDKDSESVEGDAAKEISSENDAITSRLRNKSQDRSQQSLLKSDQPQVLLLLDRKIIVEKILQAEEKFSTYLAIKSLQWTSSSERDNFIANIKVTTDLQELKQLLSMMQQSFLFVEPMSEDQHRVSGKHILDSDQEEEILQENRKAKKKSPVRLWGINSERIKQYWMKYLQQSIDLNGIWICANILKNYVDRYVKKKMDYMEEQQKKQEKQEREKEKKRYLRKEKEREKQRYLERNYISNDYERSSERIYSRERSRDERPQKRRGRKPKKVINESDSGQVVPLRPNLRERKKRRVFEMDSSEEKYSEEYVEEYQNEDEEDQSDSQDRCEICNEYGEMICCDTCPKVFHLDCVKLKEIPEGEWSCLDCLRDLANKRQTRSKVRRMANGSSI